MPQVARDVFCLDCNRTVTSTGCCPICGSEQWAALTVGGARILPWVRKNDDEELTGTSSYPWPFGETEV